MPVNLFKYLETLSKSSFFEIEISLCDVEYDVSGMIYLEIDVTHASYGFLLMGSELLLRIGSQFAARKRFGT